MIRRFWRLVRPDARWTALIVGLSLLGSLFDGASVGLLVPLLANLQHVERPLELPAPLRRWVDLTNGFPPERRILFGVAVVVAAIVVKNALVALSIHLGHRHSARLLADLRERVLRGALHAGLEFHHQTRASDLVSFSLQSAQHVGILFASLVSALAHGSMLVVLTAMLFVLSWQLTLVTLVLAALCLAFLTRHMRDLQSLGEQEERAGRDVHAVVHEAIAGIQLIKSYSREERVLETARPKVAALLRVENARGFKSWSIHPLAEILGTIGTAIVFAVGLVVYGHDTPLLLTHLLPFVYVLLRIVPLLKLAGIQKADIAHRSAHIEKLEALLRADDKSTIPDGPAPFPGLRTAIELRDVSFAFRGASAPILHDVHLTIPAGKVTAIVGESGAGKSTLSCLLLRLYDPTRGALFIDGEPLTRYDVASYHRRIGVVSQDTFLFNASVAENIAFGADGTVARAALIDAAKQAGAHEFIAALANGYDTVVGDRGVKLSGGQRQRLAIARAILRDPELLILDEATSSLDSRTERRIHDAIGEFGRGRTVIVIAHRLSTVEGADQIVVLKQGRVAEVGTPAELAARAGEYFRLTTAS